MGDDLNQLVKAAQQGQKQALEALVVGVQDQIYHLALRMLVNPEDAREACQEILILVVTKLSTFQGKSRFQTWVYRVAVHYLLTAQKIQKRELGLTFEQFAADLEEGLLVDPAPPADDVVLLNELRVSCTMAMLLCLDLKHRVAYVLGDILELDHTEASEILALTKSAYRKRLSRARSEIIEFTSAYCGLANQEAACSCPRKLAFAQAKGRVSKQNIVHAVPGAPAYEEVLAQVQKLEAELKVLKLQTSTVSYRCPTDLGAHIADIVQTNSF